MWEAVHLAIRLMVGSRLLGGDPTIHRCYPVGGFVVICPTLGLLQAEPLIARHQVGERLAK